ncbi:unnamed protein product [Cladocopium goreaui]|uniref:DRBM domain-containing protein n=1 Tax=Cladocopium goreaui TaxID=2562237 RepID=A0A9P1D4H2_9DINO|nr:unnamed protein product [Cladocopium goreaui]
MQYQAIVTLHCMDKQEYAGHLCDDPKVAEKSAAQQALLANSDLVEAQKREVPTKRPSGMMLSPEERAKKARVDPAENPAITPKTELNSLCMRIIGRYMKKGETIYICNRIASQYQSTVQITCLPDEWGQRAWAGHLCANKQKAEQSAAEIALKDIKDDPQLQELAASSKGKGKGKGNYWNMQMMWEMMNNWWGGWSDEREIIIEEPIIGEMIEWKGHYGWMKTDHPIEHDAKAMRGGKIYINKKDIEGTPETVAEGQKVQFKLYVDGNGLGGPKRRRGGFGSLAATELTVAVEEADLFLAPLGVKGMTLHIQSGEGDCGVSTFLPQEPIPRAIFPRCTRSGNLELRRNPSDHCIAGLQVVGHSGQPLALASRNAPKGAPVSHMDMLLQSWQSQYLAPLWPELLMKADAVPERQDDPFGIKLRPEAQKVLLFSGNSPGARWELAPGLDSAEPLGQKDVLAVCIPKFQEEPTILLVDSEDLSVQQLRFSVS